MANSLPLKPTMHRATSVFTFLTSLGSGAIKYSMKIRMVGGGQVTLLPYWGVE